MKNLLVIIFTVCLIIILGACNPNGMQQDEKYTMNATYSYGGDTEKTEISYEITISGTEEEIKNIDAYEVLINMDYLDLMMENGPHNSQTYMGQTPYLKITGFLTFDTSGKDKEEIDKMNFLEGVKIIDKQENEVILPFPDR